MIAQNQISKLSNRLFKEKGGRRVPELVLERDYCVAWFLVGLANVALKEKIVFKGGTALRRCHFPDYRFSEDLDFTLLQLMTFDELKKELEPIYEYVRQTSNISFQFSRTNTNAHQNSYTFYLAYEGPLPRTATPKEIKVDVTIKERMVHPSQGLPVQKNCNEYTDLPEKAIVRVYSLAEIATEKTVALLDRARTEPRDLYDLWYLTEIDKAIDLAECLGGVMAKLEHREKKLDDVRGEFEKKESRLRRTWESRLNAQMTDLPKFDGVFRAVKRSLRQAKITSP